jgi:hypothetical protein
MRLTLSFSGPLAQLAEQLTLNQQVQGSIPWRLTKQQFSFEIRSGGA